MNLSNGERHALLQPAQLILRELYGDDSAISPIHRRIMRSVRDGFDAYALQFTDSKGRAPYAPWYGIAGWTKPKMIPAHKFATWEINGIYADALDLAFALVGSDNQFISEAVREYGEAAVLASVALASFDSLRSETLIQHNRELWLMYVELHAARSVDAALHPSRGNADPAVVEKRSQARTKNAQGRKQALQDYARTLHDERGLGREAAINVLMAEQKAGTAAVAWRRPAGKLYSRETLGDYLTKANPPIFGGAHRDRRKR